MVAYVARRVAFAVLTFFAVTFVAFMVFHVIPVRFTPPNQPPLVVRYWHFLQDLVLHGSLGAAFRFRGGGGRDVTTVVLQTAPITASIVLGGALLWLLISVPLGVLTAMRARSLFDRTTLAIVLLLISVHPIWLGLTLSYLFGFKLGLTPIAGYCEAFGPPPGALCGGVGAWASHLVLPCLTFALLFAALYTRMMRTGVLEELGQDYVRTARAKGASERRVVRHVLRNVLLPLVTMLGMDVPVALGGALYIEVVFGLPGLGNQAWQAIQREDYPVLQGDVIFTSLCVIVATLVIDLVYVLLDPRVRVAARPA